MEKNPELKISVVQNVPRGEFILQVNGETFYGTITDLSDSFIAGGLTRREILNNRDTILTVNSEDWEQCQDLIWHGDTN